VATLRVVTAQGVTPARLARWGTTLLAQDLGTATLVVAELDEAAVLLGRHQRAVSALDGKAVAARGFTVARRLGGGKAIVVNPGTIAVQLAVPPGSGLGVSFGADRAINRHVRGLLRGLGGGLGGAFYFGRDFVSADKRQVAIVSQDGAPGGGTQLFEAFVARTAALALPAELSKYPLHGDSRAAGPAHTSLVELGRGRQSFAEIAQAIANGYAQATGAALAPTEAAALDDEDGANAALDPPVAEDDTGWAWSGVADVPIGFLEAQVQLDGRHVRAARLRGDFIAPAFAVRHLEASLAGGVLEFAHVAPLVDAALALPGATIVGVTHLRLIADAFVACAETTA
jgi:hypothetical protein